MPQKADVLIRTPRLEEIIVSAYLRGGDDDAVVKEGKHHLSGDVKLEHVAPLITDTKTEPDGRGQVIDARITGEEIAHPSRRKETVVFSAHDINLQLPPHVVLECGTEFDDAAHYLIGYRGWKMMPKADAKTIDGAAVKTQAVNVPSQCEGHCSA